MKFAKGDYVIVAIVLIAACALWLSFPVKKGQNGVATILQNGKIIRQIQLKEINKPETIRLGGTYHNTIIVEKGRIRYQSADCPDKICVHTGWISYVGQSAACLPNKTIIRITGNLDGVDFVSGS